MPIFAVPLVFNVLSMNLVLPLACLFQTAPPARFFAQVVRHAKLMRSVFHLAWSLAPAQFPARVPILVVTLTRLATPRVVAKLAVELKFAPRRSFIFHPHLPQQVPSLWHPRYCHLIGNWDILTHALEYQQRLLVLLVRFVVS